MDPGLPRTSIVPSLSEQSSSDVTSASRICSPPFEESSSDSLSTSITTPTFLQETNFPMVTMRPGVFHPSALSGGYSTKSTSGTEPIEDVAYTEYYSAANTPIIANKAARPISHRPMTRPDGQHPASANPPFGELVFDSSMKMVKSRKLGPRSRSERISLRFLKQMGGACEKHKNSKKKCQCYLGINALSSCTGRSALLKEKLPSRIDDCGWLFDDESPSPAKMTMMTSQALDCSLNVGLIENDSPPQKPLFDEATYRLERTPVFSCPFLFTGCQFVAFSCAEWSSHVEQHERAWETQNNRPNGPGVGHHRP